MFSKDMLVGILLSNAKMDFLIERDKNTYMGYRVRLKLKLRAEEPFLLAVQRSLLQHEINSKYSPKESMVRQKPILKIGGIKNLYKISELVPKALPDSKGEWEVFREVIQLIDEGRHKTAHGLERILELKGLI
tara:strand:- start:148 stop:546 length:399 start_codon:yes stop_codon:yes gene_type:complete